MTFKNLILRARGVIQVVECLPTKCEALSSNPNITHTRKEFISARMVSSRLVSKKNQRTGKIAIAK
jgi:hypothetical protein